MAARSQNEVETRRLATLLNTGSFADCTIHCGGGGGEGGVGDAHTADDDHEANHTQSGGHVFHAHKAILYTKSEFFNRTIGGKFSESTKNKIMLPEDDPGILARVLSFMYLGSYSTKLCPTICGVKLDVFGGINETEMQDQMIHARVFGMAELYDIPPLCDASKVRFLKSWYREDDTEKEEDMEQGKETEREVELEVPDPPPEHATPENEVEVADAVAAPASPSTSRSPSPVSSSGVVYNEETSSFEPPYWYEPSIGEVIRTVYTTTPEHVRALRDIVLRTTLGKIKANEAVQSRRFRKFLAEIPDFARDLVVHEQSRDLAKCWSCEELSRVLVGECQCGRINVGFCKKDLCRQKWSRRSFCVHCYRFGTMEYPQADYSE